MGSRRQYEQVGGGGGGVDVQQTGPITAGALGRIIVAQWARWCLPRELGWMHPSDWAW